MLDQSDVVDQVKVKGGKPGEGYGKGYPNQNRGRGDQDLMPANPAIAPHRGARPQRSRTSAARSRSDRKRRQGNLSIARI